MKTEQLSVFLENRAGTLARVLETLAEENINIRGLSLAETTDFGILRMIVSDQDKARRLLKERGCTVGAATVVAVEINDQSGGLNAVVQLASANDINIEYMYASMQREQGKAIMIFRFDKVEEAMTILANNGVKIISQDDLRSF